jgi:NADH-quinone oxidoreductase subunit G
VAKFQQEVGGPLKGGDPGIRVIEPRKGGTPPWFREVPPAFSPRSGVFLAIPFHRVFGSEELSFRSPSVEERAEGPYLVMNPEDAAILGIAPGMPLGIFLSGNLFRASARLDPSLPRGLAGLPAGMGGWKGTPLPAWMKVAGGTRP